MAVGALFLLCSDSSQTHSIALAGNSLEGLLVNHPVLDADGRNTGYARRLRAASSRRPLNRTRFHELEHCGDWTQKAVQFTQRPEADFPFPANAAKQPSRTGRAF